MSGTDTLPTVFAWITGERTNVGDSLLRRPYVRALARFGNLDVWTRRSTPAFLSGLSLPPTARVEPSFVKWYGRLLLSAMRHETILALNAGQTPSTRSAVPAAILLDIATKLIHLRGGRVVWLGASLAPELTRLQSAAYVRLARSADVVAWREGRSWELTKLGDVQPDWAFAEGTAPALWNLDERRTLAIVIRGDRPHPGVEWVGWIARTAQDLNLDVCAIVQVEADADRAHELAEALGGAVMPWQPGTSHADQERAVREVYRRSALVVGDRLHGLVMAATEGAVALGWVPTSRGKIGLHFAPVDLRWVSDHEGHEFDSVPELTQSRLAAMREDLQAKIELARTRLSAVDELV